LLLGFDSDHTRRHIVTVAAGHPEIAKQGVLLRKYGQEVIRIVSGKRVHGAAAIPGGMNKPLARDDRDTLRRDIDCMIAWSRDAVQMMKRLYETDAAFYRGFGEAGSNLLSLVGEKGALDLYHGRLRARAADGGNVFDGADYADYAQLLQEEVKPWSYMKFPHIRSLGKDAGWYKVGPLARVQNCDFIPSALAEVERREFVALGDGRPMHGALLYHWARLIELLHAAEVIRELLDDPDIVGKDLVAERGTRVNEAVGVIEAPRGTLIHHYRVADNDLVSFCNLIVSTTNNNQAMNEAVREVARQHLCGREITEGLLNHLEVAIRAYDPCLSCATHALGKMPLEVELLDAEGAVVDRRRRNFTD
jgi:NAD-reducing hydrogenase large subunit